MVDTLLQPGDIVADRYYVEGQLGVGGHAYVYTGRQVGIGRKVAIKILKGSNELGDQKVDTLKKRFEQEAKLIAQLKDPHTITLYDYGMTKGGHLYMASEFVDGVSLKELQKVEGALGHERVLSILKQLLSSLQEAHALGVLHRDIKPDNIMLHSHLGRGDQVKLLDFGIAKLVGSDTSDLTAEGSVVGTPRYIPPERVTSGDLRPASDLYSLGMVAYEMLVGTRVYEGKKGIEVLRAQIQDESLRLPKNIGVPDAMAEIVDKLMEKPLELRYALAGEVLQDIDAYEQMRLIARQPVPTPRPMPAVSAGAPRHSTVTLAVSHLLAFVVGALCAALLFLFLVR